MDIIIVYDNIKDRKSLYNSLGILDELKSAIIDGVNINLILSVLTFTFVLDAL